MGNKQTKDQTVDGVAAEGMEQGTSAATAPVTATHASTMNTNTTTTVATKKKKKKPKKTPSPPPASVEPQVHGNYNFLTAGTNKRLRGTY
jgi:hypothetical protein